MFVHVLASRSFVLFVIHGTCGYLSVWFTRSKFPQQNFIFTQLRHECQTKLLCFYLQILFNVISMTGWTNYTFILLYLALGMGFILYANSWISFCGSHWWWWVLMSWWLIWLGRGRLLDLYWTMNTWSMWVLVILEALWIVRQLTAIFQKWVLAQSQLKTSQYLSVYMHKSESR